MSNQIFNHLIATSDHARFMRLLVGVIAGANQRSAGRMAESHCQRFLLELNEARRLDVAQHRQVAAGGLQILAQGGHFHVVVSQVAHHLQGLIVGPIYFANLFIAFAAGGCTLDVTRIDR